MSKIKVLKYNQAMMIPLGIYPLPPTATYSKLLLHSFSPYFMIITMILCNILSTTYVYQGSTRLSYIFEAFTLIIGGSEALSVYINMRWKMNRVGDVQLKLQGIVDEGINLKKNSISNRKPIRFISIISVAIKQNTVALIYQNVEQNCRHFTIKMTTFVLFQQTSFVIALIFSIYCIYVGNFDTSTYYLPLRIAAPFHIDSVFEWYLFWALQLNFGFSYSFCVIPAASFFVCSCFYLSAMCDHFNYLIALVEAEFDRNVNETMNKCSSDHQNSLNARKLLSNTIDHHNKIYE